LFLARLPGEAAGAVAQDRPLVYYRNAQGCQRDDARLHDRLAGALATPHGRRRGGGDGRTGKNTAPAEVRRDAGLSFQQAAADGSPGRALAKELLAPEAPAGAGRARKASGLPLA